MKNKLVLIVLVSVTLTATLCAGGDENSLTTTPYKAPKNPAQGKQYTQSDFDAVKEAENAVLSILSQAGNGNNLGLEYRYAIDAAISTALNIPFDQVSRNHKAYMYAFTGTDVEDKGFFEAFIDAWKSDGVNSKIARKRRQFDKSSDGRTQARLLNEIAELEKQLVLLGDYKQRSCLLRHVIKWAPIIAHFAKPFAILVAVGIVLLVRSKWNRRIWVL